MERRRHDAEYGVGVSVEGDGFPEDGGIALKLGPPEIVHEHHDAVAAGLGLLRREGTAEQRRDAEDGEDAGGSAENFDLERMPADAQRHGVLFDRSHRLKAAAVLLPVDEVVGGDRQLRIDVAELGHPLLYDDQLVRLRKRQWPEYCVIDQREDRRGRADAERQRQQSGESKAGRPGQLAQCIAQILKERSHRVPNRGSLLRLYRNSRTKPYPVHRDHSQ
jgi:hypothetical protein